MSTEFFSHQLRYFSKSYRVINFDPRSQGRSSRTLQNNNYTQHGKDLQAIMQELGLSDVVLVGCRTLGWALTIALVTAVTGIFTRKG